MSDELGQDNFPVQVSGQDRQSNDEREARKHQAAATPRDPGSRL